MVRRKLSSKFNIVAAIGLSAAALVAACSGADSSNSSSGFSGSGGSSSAGNGSGQQSSGSDVGGGTFVGSTGSNSAASGQGGGCAGTSSKAEQIPLDMYIMLDQSGSMSSPVNGGGTRWTAVTQALANFVVQPGLNGISVGIQYFGLPDPNLGDSCTPSDYAKPEVEIAPLPGISGAIVTSLSQHSPSTGTPTSAALQGAIDHAKAWEQAHPTHLTIVVFATDGQPGECDTNLSNIDAIAAAGFAGNPSILTFVIGVGPSTGNLDGIAAAGGTMSAFLVDTNGNAGQQFLDAMNKIRGSVLSCTYLIPKPQMGMLDFNQVNVQYTPGAGGMPITIPKVQDKASCPANGLAWYYDNNAAPTQIILCDSTCTQLSMDAKAEVNIVLGCSTVIN